MAIDYRDQGGAESSRTIWPIALGFLDQVQVIAAWCELRQAFRHFRADRVVRWQLPGERYPVPHGELFQKWQEETGIHAPDF
jgi:predicted DNA-binding transcriptional regulator YafY